MCGIVGWMGRGATPDIDAAVGAIRHRGPDAQRSIRIDAGDRSVLLGHARLSIIDLSEGGAQPMCDASGRVVIVFNGEIYNFAELRRELEDGGVRLRSASDTEVILEGYLRWGREVLHKLRGMFAFAIWDGRDESLWLVRDRLGIKPLYLAEVPGGVAFASELRALFALGLPRRMAPGALDRFLTYLYVPGPETAFVGVRELLPAHHVVVRRGEVSSPQRYWDLPPIDPSLTDARELALDIRRELEVVTAQHAVADVPVGAFLSGGLDSSTIVGLMQRRSSMPLRTFCMTFGRGAERYDERSYAREVASWFGTEHTEIPVEPSLVDLLPRALSHFGQPFGNPTALLSYELSRLTREHVTVALAGDGGDELFLGYPRYAGVALARATSWVPRSVRRAAAQTLAPLIRESVSGNHSYRRAREFLSTSALPLAERYGRWVGYFDPAERSSVLLPEHHAPRPSEEFLDSLFAARPRGGDVERANYVDLLSFLPNNVLAYGDRMSMAHGLELRVPYCDHVLVEKVARIPASVRMPGLSLKKLLRSSVADLLPPRILRRPKLGFNPPIGLWINRELSGLVREHLDPRALRAAGVFDPAGVSALLAAQRDGRRDVSLKVWAVLVAQMWMERDLGAS